MRKNLNRTLLYSSFLLLFFSGCGDGSSTTSNNPIEVEERAEGGSENEMNENETQESNGDDSLVSGECTTLPKIVVGDSYTLRNTDKTNGSVVDVETIVTDFTSTQISYTTNSSGAITATGTKVETVSIHDNYLDITKIVTKDRTTTAQGITVDTDITMEMTPYSRYLYNSACTGKSWTNEYDLKTTTTVLGQPIVVDSHTKETSTVEAVNESKDIALGTFNTMKIKTTNSDGTYKVLWYDLDKARLVYGEHYNASGGLISTQELIAQK